MNRTQTIQSIFTYTRDIHRENTLWINFNIRYNRRMKLNMTQEQLEEKIIIKTTLIIQYK